MTQWQVSDRKKQRTALLLAESELWCNNGTVKVLRSFVEFSWTGALGVFLIWLIQFQLVKSSKVQELRDRDRPESSSLELVLDQTRGRPCRQTRWSGHPCYPRQTSCMLPVPGTSCADAMWHKQVCNDTNGAALHAVVCIGLKSIEQPLSQPRQTCCSLCFSLAFVWWI